MIKTNVTNGKLSQKEIDTYISYGIKKYPKQPIKAIDIEVDGDYANVTYHFEKVPFQRIRRITGYLVGTLDRFNDAKKSEVRDRVKHDLGGE